MKYNYVTIEREYGSGGTQIGQKLSEVCGVPFYGREILEEVAQKLNSTVDRIERYEESTTGSLLYSIMMMGRIQSGNGNLLAGEDYIYLEEQNVIKRLAHNGPAIFMGHCAHKALEDREGVLKVFIHADAAGRRKRAEADYQIPRENVDAVMKKFDKKRSNYYYANTKQKWDDFRNYDIVLDSSTLGVDGCVEILKGLLDLTKRA